VTVVAVADHRLMTGYKQTVLADDSVTTDDHSELLNDLTGHSARLILRDNASCQYLATDTLSALREEIPLEHRSIACELCLTTVAGDIGIVLERLDQIASNVIDLDRRARWKTCEVQLCVVRRGLTRVCNDVWVRNNLYLLEYGIEVEIRILSPGLISSLT
jgi:hypothetical protein